MIAYLGPLLLLLMLTLTMWWCLRGEACYLCGAEGKCECPLGVLRRLLHEDPDEES